MIHTSKKLLHYLTIWKKHLCLPNNIHVVQLTRRNKHTHGNEYFSERFHFLLSTKSFVMTKICYQNISQYPLTGVGIIRRLLINIFRTTTDEQKVGVYKGVSQGPAIRKCCRICDWGGGKSSSPRTYQTLQ